MTLNPVYEPYQAAAWLVRRHDHAQHILDRVDCWATEEGNRFPDLAKLAEGINAADQYGVEWNAYADSTRPPSLAGWRGDEAAYERAHESWEQAGPKVTNPVAYAYLPMSSGEHRFLRVLAVLAPVTRVQFNLSDADSISLRCCYPGGGPGAGPAHTPFLDDWRQLIAGKITQ